MVFPTVDNALLTVVDLQMKLLPAMSEQEKIVSRAEVVIRGAVELGMDVVVTEQYPKGLGATLPELSTWLPDDTPVVSKTGFSVFQSPEFKEVLLRRNHKVMIFIGVEAHVCLLQSVLDALSAGYEVIVVADAVGSRKNSDRDFALDAARDAGAWVLSSESVLFMLLRDAKNPKFKAVSALIK